MKVGAIVSVLLYSHTSSPARRWGTVVAAPNSDWIVVKWHHGGFDEYVMRKSARVEREPISRAPTADANE